jgi:hypothetical protein
MNQERISFHLISNIGIFATYGVLTMSSPSNVTDTSTLNLTISSFSEFTYNYNDNIYDLSTSLMKCENQIGDILIDDENNEVFLQEHKKININIQVAKIKKHISNFDFDDEYEEI